MECLPELIELIQAATRYLDSQPVSAAFPWTQIIAMMSVIVSAATVIYTVRGNFKMQNASARMEQIREIRIIASEVMDAGHFVTIKKDTATFREVIKKTELLMLYFGSNKKIKMDAEKMDAIINDAEKLYDYLRNTDTDDGKNTLIALFLQRLVNEILLFQIAVNTVEKSTEQKKEASDKITDSCTKLQEIMRVYLNFEWEKAKRGK